MAATSARGLAESGLKEPDGSGQPRDERGAGVADEGRIDPRRRTGHVRIVVDLNRCESYAQCVFAAPKVFWLKDEESLEFDYAPDDALRVQVERAAAACPVQAIRIGRSNGRTRPAMKTSG
jgi:ferredoxin